MVTTRDTLTLLFTINRLYAVFLKATCAEFEYQQKLTVYLIQVRTKKVLIDLPTHLYAYLPVTQNQVNITCNSIIEVLQVKHFAR